MPRVAAAALDHHLGAQRRRTANRNPGPEAQVAAPAEAGLQAIEDRRDADRLDARLGIETRLLTAGRALPGDAVPAQGLTEHLGPARLNHHPGRPAGPGGVDLDPRG
jgi:hypothetical protein